MKHSLFIIVALTTFVFAQENVTRYVDPFIGTGGHGHVYPGATVPYGMVQLSPDNGMEGWDWTSGYHYSDSTIKGFSHTHLSGTGVGDLCDILCMPAVLADPEAPYSSRFSHREESASPGYYTVNLQSYGILVELTATARSGFHRYTFPKSENSRIVIDLGHRINWDSPTESQLTVVTPTLITGYRYSAGWAPNQRIFFAARFSKPIASVFMGEDSSLRKGGTSITGKGVKAVAGFMTAEKEHVLMKVGISAVSIEGALRNLDSEIPGWNFDEVRNEAKERWERELQKIVVTDADINRKKIFYTAYYRTMLAPVIYNDVDGAYRGGDDSVRSGTPFTNYSIFSLWDTYRAAHPLSTITQPERVDDFIRSMLAFYREYGALPVWTLHANETMCMIGYHSVPVITDAFLKGFRGYDAMEALKAMKTSAMANDRGLKSYRQYGYVPSDHEVESVSKTLEYAYDDWCIAQMAKALGEESDFREFLDRSAYYANVFDTTTLFMRGRSSGGGWRTPFDPLAVDHRMNDYTEGNAWQYSWYVPHDVEALIRLNGGKEQFVKRLDILFEQTERVKGENISPDISGLIGQYAHGNEPSHHIAYLYNYAGNPWKTQKRVAAIMNSMYTTGPEGLTGNEDCGQMSAWYIFSALGFYPVNPAEQVYVIGTPHFAHAVIQLPGGKQFSLKAENLSPENYYVKSVLLNGLPLKRTFIRHSEIMEGGSLIFEMTGEPAVWGSSPDDAPPSMSKELQ